MSKRKMKFACEALTILKQDGVRPLCSEAFDFITRRTVSQMTQHRMHSYWNYYRNWVKYDTLADPYKTILIRPENILYCTFEFSNAFGQVEGGNWDKEKNLELIDNQWRVKGLRQRFEEGTEWRETEYVQYCRRNIFENGETIFGCKNIEDFIEQRCTYVDELYYDIKENGYEVEGAGNDDNKKYPLKSRYKQRLEPYVLIGRNGRIILRGGYHRFTIADILDIEIPVQVVCRHTKWQQLRDNIYNSNTAYNTDKNHPDLNDIVF